MPRPTVRSMALGLSLVASCTRAAPEPSARQNPSGAADAMAATTSEPPSLVARLATIRGLEFLGRGSEATIVGDRWSIAAHGPRPAIDGSLLEDRARISADDRAWVALERIDRAGASRGARAIVGRGSVSFSRSVWGWSEHAVEHVHTIDRIDTIDPVASIVLAMEVGPAIASVEVVNGRLWLEDATGYARLQTDAAWVEDARGARRPVRPIVTGSVPSLRLELRFDATDLVPPLVVDPAWTKIPSMYGARRYAPFATLADGRVLVTCGEADFGPSGTTELYDPKTNMWTVGPTAEPSIESVVRLPSGKVFAGPSINGGKASIFDPATGAWTSTVFGTAYYNARIVALADGRVLGVGSGPSGSSATTYVSAFDPSSNTVATVASMATARLDGDAILLANGSVLAAGGSGDTSTELYDPALDRWTAGPPLSLPRGHARMIALADGRIALYSTAFDLEIFAAGAWTHIAAFPAKLPPIEDKGLVGGAPLPGTHALFFAGCDPSSCATQNALLFDGVALRPVDPLGVARKSAAIAVAIGGGRVLVAGGDGIDGPLSSAEIFEPGRLGERCSADGTCGSLACVDATCCAAPSCASDATCAGPAVAAKGSCRLRNGGACVAATDCASGACVDGVCCDRACDGQCEACDSKGAVGTCLPIVGAPHAARPACATSPATSPTTCGLACDGVDASRCVLASTTTPCSSDGCVAGIETHARLCDGAGGCADVAKPRGAYICGPLACKTTCTLSTDCAPGFGCQAGVCAPTEGLGKSCTSAGACASGACVDGVCCGAAACGSGSVCNVAGQEGSCRKTLGAPCATSAECGVGSCVDGVCCDAACTGACEACDVAGREGSCVAVLGATHGARPACATGADPCSAKACDGKARATCSGFAKSSETTCAPAQCEAGHAVGASRCDGAGACVTPTASACTPFTCDGAVCKTVCASDVECANGFRCVSSRCIEAGARCSPDGQSSQSKDGVAASCAPYICNPSSGTCAIGCLSTADCATTFVCVAGSCLAPSPAATSAGGCAWSTRAPRSGRGEPASSAWLIGLGAAAIVASRRRRSALARSDAARRLARIACGPLLALMTCLVASCSRRDARVDGVDSVDRISRAPTSPSIAAAPPATSAKGWTVASGGVYTNQLNPVLVQLADGSVLTFGTGAVVFRVSPSTATVVEVGALSTDRNRALVARLPSGKVLIAGGSDPATGLASSTAEIFDPALNTSTPAPSMNVPRRGRGAIALPDGDVLVTSSVDPYGTDVSAQLYVEAKSAWQPAASIPFARASVMILLDSGKVLNLPQGSSRTTAAFVYDPALDTWTTGAKMLAPEGRTDLNLARLPSGKILLVSAGPHDLGAQYGEIYDPVADTFKATSNLPARVDGPDVATLPSGRVLVAGGYGYSAIRTATLVYDPVGDAWLDASPMPFADVVGGALALADGRALVFSGGGGGGPSKRAAFFSEVAVGGPCFGDGDCQNLQCVDGVCCGTSSCAVGNRCVAPTGACRVVNGGACSAASACASGNCVDSVCCDTACTGQCAACNVAGLVGTCSPSVGAPRGARPACAGAGLGTACGANCDGAHSDACTFAPAASPCGSDACRDGAQTRVSTCDGAGHCADTTSRCAPYACGPITCATTCASASDCGAGAYCTAGACVPIEGLGSTCASEAQCTSGGCVDGVCCATSTCAAGFVCNDPAQKGTCTRSRGSACSVSAECANGHCVDGVCCDSTCAGACEACDVVGNVGTCTPVDGAPHGARSACPGAIVGPNDPTGACSARTCLGSKDANRCAGFIGAAGTSCGAARCDVASFYAPSTCDGQGACALSTAASCAPYACNGLGCLKQCALDVDCAAGWVCRAAACVVAGATCTNDLAASVASNEVVTVCAPYRCSTDGACAKSCASTDACASGYVCDTATQTCTTSGTGSSGCAWSRARTSTTGALLAGLACAAMLARRRGPPKKRNDRAK